MRARSPGAPAAAQLHYVHPSGQLAVAGRTVTTTLDWFPPLETGEELLLFLVRVGKGPAYRTSLRRRRWRSEVGRCAIPARPLMVAAPRWMDERPRRDPRGARHGLPAAAAQTGAAPFGRGLAVAGGAEVRSRRATADCLWR